MTIAWELSAEVSLCLYHLGLSITSSPAVFTNWRVVGWNPRTGGSQNLHTSKIQAVSRKLPATLWVPETTLSTRLNTSPRSHPLSHYPNYQNIWTTELHAMCHTWTTATNQDFGDLGHRFREQGTRDMLTGRQWDASSHLHPSRIMNDLALLVFDLYRYPGISHAYIIWAASEYVW